MATTTNYGWTTPNDTDLVKDGAAAIRTLGSSIDTTTKNLNPETTTGDIAYRSATANTNTRLAIGSTGQVLTVAGGVPVWADGDDANAIQNSIVDAKGDIIAASADNTPARLAVGTNDHRLVAASGEATGLKYVADTQNTVIDAAGDLLYGTAADTLARLAIGTAGQVLTVNSGATAPQWAAPASGVPANDNNFVSTQQSTTSNSFTDLTTTQAVTVTTGTKALVIVGAAINSDGGSGGGYVGCTVSGASSISASTDQAFGYNSQVGSKAFMYDNLTAGSNTFTLKFRRLNATGNAYFSDREIVVVDMGS